MPDLNAIAMRLSIDEVPVNLQADIIGSSDRKAATGLCGSGDASFDAETALKTFEETGGEERQRALRCGWCR